MFIAKHVNIIRVCMSALVPHPEIQMQIHQAEYQLILGVVDFIEGAFKVNIGGGGGYKWERFIF